MLIFYGSYSTIFHVVDAPGPLFLPLLPEPWQFHFSLFLSKPKFIFCPLVIQKSLFSPLLMALQAKKRLPPTLLKNSSLRFSCVHTSLGFLYLLFLKKFKSTPPCLHYHFFTNQNIDCMALKQAVAFILWMKKLPLLSFSS